MTSEPASFASSATELRSAAAVCARFNASDGLLRMDQRDVVWPAWNRHSQRFAATGPGWKVPCVAVLAASMITGCATAGPATPSPVACRGLPNSYETLLQAWQAYQPDQPMPFTIPVRRELFALQALLISAGMYDESPSDPTTVYAQYAPEFVRDLGMSRNPGLAGALDKLSQTLEQHRDGSEADLGNNCGLLLARRMLYDDPVGVATDWVLQVVTGGFAPTFQASIYRIVHDHAQACSQQPEIARVPESVLMCTIQRGI